jgi:hypothetical protein
MSPDVQERSRHYRNLLSRLDQASPLRDPEKLIVVSLCINLESLMRTVAWRVSARTVGFS